MCAWVMEVERSGAGLSCADLTYLLDLKRVAHVLPVAQSADLPCANWSIFRREEGYTGQCKSLKEMLRGFDESAALMAPPAVSLASHKDKQPNRTCINFASWNCLLDVNVMGNMQLFTSLHDRNFHQEPLRKQCSFRSTLFSNQRSSLPLGSTFWRFGQMGKRKVDAILARSAWTNWELTPSSNNRKRRPDSSTTGRAESRTKPDETPTGTLMDNKGSRQVQRSTRKTDPFPHISPCSNSSQPERYIYATWHDVIKYIHLNLNKHSNKTHLKMSNVSLKEHYLIDVKLKFKI